MASALARTVCIVLGLVAVSSGCDGALDELLLHQWDSPDESLLDDGHLHVVLCGTGLPIPNVERGAACTAVAVDGELVLVDAGPGAIERADLLELPVTHLSRVLITHFHSDHIGGLGQALAHSWFRGREQTVHVYGPPGIERIVRAFDEVYAWDTHARTLPGADELDARWRAPVVHEITVSGPDAEALVFESGDLRVWAFEVDHGPTHPAYGYRIEWSGRSVVWSGDTRSYPPLARHAHGADLLIHSASGLPEFLVEAAERLQARGELPRTDRDLFATPVEAARIAQAAGAKTLVFSHIPPITGGVFEWYWLRGVDDVFDGEVIVGRDGMRFDFEPRDRS